MAGDTVIQTLKVVSEGILQSVSQAAVIFKNKSTTSFSSNLKCDLPSDAMLDTVSVSATVGDLTGLNFFPETRFDPMALLPKWESWRSYYKMLQTDGFKQTLSYASDVVRLKYFKATRQLTDSLKTSILESVTEGFSIVMDYKRSDSSFGYNDINDGYIRGFYPDLIIVPDSSLYLTAFVARVLIWEKPFVTIDRTPLINSSLDFVVNSQNLNGSFSENGRTLIEVTSSIAVVLLENLNEFPQYTSKAQAALNYIISNGPSSNLSELIISTHALQLGFKARFISESKFHTFYNQLMNQSTETGVILYWHSLNYEAHSYALPLLLNTDLVKAVKLVKYLNGNLKKFGVTQHTEQNIVGIEALARYIELIWSASESLDINLRPNHDSSITAKVNAENVFADQRFDLKPRTRQLEVCSRSGSRGISKVTLTCQFNTLQEILDNYKITQKLTSACDKRLKSEICVIYIPPRYTPPQLNLSVIVTVSMLSGYIYHATVQQPSNIEVRNERF